MNPIEFASMLAEATYKAQRRDGYSILHSFCTALMIGINSMKQDKAH